MPLIGFSAAPWTLFYYMVGGSSKKNQQAKRWSGWKTFTSDYKNILDGDQYVQVQVALSADASMRAKSREYQQIKSVEVRSECH